MKNYAEKILASNTSYQKDTWANLSKQMTVEAVLSEIKSDANRKQVEYLRQLIKIGNNESYKVEKLKLPAVTFCGTFLVARKKR